MPETFSTDQWKAKAAGLSLQNKAFIGGQYVASASGETFDCISPCDGTLLTQVANCGEEDVDRAVKAARAAFERGDWRNMAPKDRKAALMRFAQLIENNTEELAVMETIDAGKPIKHTPSSDIPDAVKTTRSTSPRRSVATSSRASDATSLSTRSTNTTRSRSPGSS